MDQKQLYEILTKGSSLSKDTKSVLLELDTTPSVSTQAYLNDLLLLFRKRLVDKEVITDETTGKPLTVKEFDQWINDQFTSYSAKMYEDSLKEATK